MSHSTLLWHVSLLQCGKKAEKEESRDAREVYLPRRGGNGKRTYDLQRW